MAEPRPRTRAPAPPPAADSAPLAADGLDGARTDADAIGSMMSELAGASSAKVTVYRAVRNQPLAYMFACTPAEFSLDDLRDRYNGGDFRLYIAKDGALWRNVRVSVEPPQGGRPADVAAPSGLAELASVMRDGFARQAEALAARATAPPPPPPWAGLDIPATIAAAAAAISALRGPAPAVMPAAPADNGGAAVDMLLRGIELAKELRSEGGDDPGMMGVLRDLVRSPMLAQAVGAMAAQSAPPAAARPAAPRPAPVLQHAQAAPGPAAPVEPPPAPNTETPPMFSHYLAMLTSRAADGADPTLYADLVLDGMSESQIRMVLNAQPDAVSALVAIYPPAAAHRDWFERMVAEVRAALDSPQELSEGAGFPDIVPPV